MIRTVVTTALDHPAGEAMPSKFRDTAYASKRVLCPYYLAETQQDIKCEGVEESASSRLSFKCREDKKSYQERYCCNVWKDCRLADMLERKWEELL
jgi:hypothetical protein